MRTILITGGLGFVGGRLARRLSEKYNVFVSSRNIATQEAMKQQGNLKHLLHNKLLTKDGFPNEIDTVIHLAALNEWDCVNYPSEAIRVNIDETRIVLENSIAKEVQQFIYFSTAHIYGSPLTGIIDENSVPVPVHPYAITHKAAEDYIVAATLQKKIKGIVIRLSNSFGAPVLPTVNRWTLLANDLCRQAIEREQLTLLTNGCQYRDFVCLSDVEQVIYEMINARESRFEKIIYNLGAGSARRVIDMAGIIVECHQQLFGKEIPIKRPQGVATTTEPLFQFSIERLKQEGCHIKNDIHEEIRQLLLFCKQNFSKLD